jgi:hypothetical protein
MEIFFLNRLIIFKKIEYSFTFVGVVVAVNGHGFGNGFGNGFEFGFGTQGTRNASKKSKNEECNEY